jgi:hypothetical protein
MTRDQWLVCKNPDMMLAFARGNRDKISSRKLRLFAALCCRQVWDLLTERSRHAVEVAERWAEGIAAREEIAEATNNARQATHDVSLIWRDSSHASENARMAAAIAAAHSVGTASKTANRSARLTAEHVVQALSWKGTRGLSDGKTGPARTVVCDLFRHIVGNPFRSHPRSWPSTVVQLAESLYNGQDCAFALHDALLEVGHAELAEHFRQEETWHPKGCWVVDLVLGKD